MSSSGLPAMLDFLNGMNNLRTPTGHLGISRSQMPQIEGVDIPAFIKFMKDHGVTSKLIWVKAGNLKLAQNEINKLKVMTLMNQRQIRLSG